MAIVATEEKKKGNGSLHKFSSASPLMDLFCRTSTNRRVGANVRRNCRQTESRGFQRSAEFTVFYQIAWDDIDSYNSGDKSFQISTDQRTRLCLKKIIFIVEEIKGIKITTL